MKINNIYKLVAVLMLLNMSCSKDWLVPNPKSFFSPENVYINKAGFQSLLITMRKDLKIESTNNINNFVLESAASDLGSPWSQLDFFNLTPNSDRYYRFLSLYTDIYAIVKNANVLISRIDDIEWESEDDRNSILAEAYWHRAYWYYRLVNTYGDVPFINEEITGAKLDFFTHSRDAILAKIQSDVEYAANWLPEKVGTGAVSKGAAKHLLARIYLASRKYDQAIAAATDVINGPYALMTERFGADLDDQARNVIWDLHRPKNISISQNTETIMASIDRFEAPPDARAIGLYTMRLYNPQWFQSQVLDSEGKQGMMASGPQYDSLGRGNANVRLTAHYQYGIWNYGGQDWTNSQDLRRADKNWVDKHEILYNNPGSVDFGKPVNSAYFANPVDTFKHLYAIPHYIMYVPQDDPNARPFGGNGDWYLMRLAETYLIRAEAHLWKGQLSEAAADINAIRARSNAIEISPNEVTIDFIMDERARELFAEDARHAEMVRVSFIMAAENLNGYSLGTFSENNFYFDRIMKYNETYDQKIELLGNVANMGPIHVLWPIPSKVITANTLGHINQNIGYDGADKNIEPLQIIE